MNRPQAMLTVTCWLITTLWIGYEVSQYTGKSMSESIYVILLLEGVIGFILGMIYIFVDTYKHLGGD